MLAQVWESSPQSWQPVQGVVQLNELPEYLVDDVATFVVDKSNDRLRHSDSQDDISWGIVGKWRGCCVWVF